MVCHCCEGSIPLFCPESAVYAGFQYKHPHIHSKLKIYDAGFMTSGNEKILKDIAKGSGIIFSGEFLSLFLQFVCGIIVIRCISKSEYGLLSLSITIVNIVVTLSSFGLNDGAPRMLSKYHAVEDYGRIYGTIHNSILITVITGFSLCFCLFFWSDQVAILFNKPELSIVLRFLCFLIPAMAFTNTMVSLSRGFKQTIPKLLYDISVSGARLVAYLFIICVGLGFEAILKAQLFAFYTTCILLFVYSFRKLKVLIPHAPRTDVMGPLIRLSLPIMGIAVLSIIGARVAILFLGYFEPSETVGLYNAAKRLVPFISIPIRTLAFIYLPIATQLYSKQQFQELHALYLSVTKWTCLLSLPLAMILVTDSEFVLTLLFGSKYAPAANTLKILGVAFILPVIAGPNAVTLLTIGKTNAILIANFIGAALNIGLCLLLIPAFGIIGTAISVLVTMLVPNLIFSAIVYRQVGIHPLSKNYIKPVMLSIAAAVPAIFLCDYLFPTGIISRFICYILISLFTLISPFLTGSVDDEDISVIRSIERKIFPKGMSFLKKYLKSDISQ